MTAFDFYSIGHSNSPAERFVAICRQKMWARLPISARRRSRASAPGSRARTLTRSWSKTASPNRPYGAALGGRPQSAELYCDGVADYEAMAQQPGFQAGLEELIADRVRCRNQGRICLMCAEREPLDCHRCLLVARALAARGFGIGHILHDGKVEPHAATERRLLQLAADDGDLFATGLSERIAAAYRRRARAVAYRAKANPAERRR